MHFLYYKKGYKPLNKTTPILDAAFKNINMDRVVKIRNSLLKLMKLRGLDDIKDTLIDNILYFIVNEKKKEMLHMCIMGPPGTGKTVLAEIIADIYKNIGILKKGHIVKVGRTDFIGKFVGHTESNTTDIIKRAEGGILFIDEVYSLADKHGKDSFSKACIDILTQHLDKHCDNILCIIAGYKEDIEDYFFSSNKGLARRFPFKFTIKKYTYDILFDIFCDKMIDDGWEIDKTSVKSLKTLFRDNYNLFKSYAGDVENLVQRYRRVHNRKYIFSGDNDKTVKCDILQTAINILFENSDKIELWTHNIT